MWASGTADDFIDFLRKFRDYAAGLIDPASDPDITAGELVTGANATGTLTLAANVANGDTVTIGRPAGLRVYTFQTVLTDVNGNVKIGANASASLDNLIAAINLAAGAGSTYAASTVKHPRVTAAAGAGDTMVATAIISGPGGNLIATTEASANASWGAATLTGGSGVRWSIMPNGPAMTALPGSGFATDGECYLAGPGSDPEDEIFTGYRTYRNSGANIFGWEMRGYTQFDRDLAHGTMPGISDIARAVFDDASFNVWFWVSARRCMAIARVGSTDILVHLGFVQQFSPRSRYPYPLLISGSVNAATISFQTAHFGHSCLPDPCGLATYLRWIDGTWLEFRNYTGSSSQRGIARVNTGNVVWPMRDPTTNPSGGIGGAGSETDLYEGFTVNSTLIESSSEISAYALKPCVLMNGTQLVGRIEGLFVVTGLGLVAGDTITIASGAYAGTYDVFKNTWRGEVIDFFAVLRD